MKFYYHKNEVINQKIKLLIDKYSNIISLINANKLINEALEQQIYQGYDLLNDIGDIITDDVGLFKANEYKELANNTIYNKHYFQAIKFQKKFLKEIKLNKFNIKHVTKNEVSDDNEN